MNIKIKKYAICSAIIAVSLTLGGCSAPEISTNSIIKIVNVTTIHAKKNSKNNNSLHRNILNTISEEFVNSKKKKRIKENARALCKNFELRILQKWY